MPIEFIIIAAICAALTDYLMRRSIDVRGSTAIFLVLQLFLSFILSILVHPVRAHNYSWSTSMASFGFCGGIILGLMMKSLGKALELGPPGLTFAAMNSASVVPGLIMAGMFGSAMGFKYTSAHAIGSFMVVAGLFWAGKSANEGLHKKKWLFYAGIAFFLQALGLAWMQWRAVFITHPDACSFFMKINESEAKSQWFLPMLFLAAFLAQLFSRDTWGSMHSLPRFFHTMRSLHAKKVLANVEGVISLSNIKAGKIEMGYGVLGGIFNGGATFFLMQATECANSLQQAMLFPVFAVTVILLCNLWGRIIYKEKVNWWANTLCIIGLFIGTMDWTCFSK